MLSENGRPLSRFLAWWLGELRACLPGAISGGLFGAAERLEVALDAGEARFVLRRNGDARELGRVALDAKPGAKPGKAAAKAANRLLRRNRAASGHVTLRLPAGQVLRPNVEVPIAAAENLREVLAFEMDRHTPFSSDEVLFDFRVAGSDAELQRLSIEMLVARKRDVDQAVAVAGTMGLSPDCVTGPAAALGADAKEFNRGWFEREQGTLERLEARVAELRAATGETGRLEEKVAHLLAISGYLVEQKRSRPQMVEILDEVTRRLPDEHWLISYSFRNGTVRLAGYSDDPSSVLRLLEQSGLFSEARFAAPVTMDPRIGKERFNLIATVAREEDAQ